MNKVINHVCPKCGYCPCCGRGGYNPWIYPYQPYRPNPYRPTIQGPIYTERIDSHTRVIM